MYPTNINFQLHKKLVLFCISVLDNYINPLLYAKATIILVFSYELVVCG